MNVTRYICNTYPDMAADIRLQFLDESLIFFGRVSMRYEIRLLGLSEGL